MPIIESIKSPARRSRTAIALGLAGAVLLTGCSSTDRYKIAERGRIEPCEDSYSLYGMREDAEHDLKGDGYDKLRQKVSVQLSDIYKRTRQNKGRIHIELLMGGGDYELDGEANTRITRVGRLELKATHPVGYIDDQLASVSFDQDTPVVPVGAVVCSLVGIPVETRFVSMVEAFDTETQMYPTGDQQ